MHQCQHHQCFKSIPIGSLWKCRPACWLVVGWGQCGFWVSIGLVTGWLSKVCRLLYWVVCSLGLDWTVGKQLATCCAVITLCFPCELLQVASWLLTTVIGTWCITLPTSNFGSKLFISFIIYLLFIYYCYLLAWLSDGVGMATASVGFETVALGVIFEPLLCITWWEEHPQIVVFACLWVEEISLLVVHYPLYLLQSFLPLKYYNNSITYYLTTSEQHLNLHMHNFKHFYMYTCFCFPFYQVVTNFPQLSCYLSFFSTCNKCIIYLDMFLC